MSRPGWAVPGRFAFPFPFLPRKVTIKRGLGDLGLGGLWGDVGEEGRGRGVFLGIKKLPSTALEVCRLFGFRFSRP